MLKKRIFSILKYLIFLLIGAGLVWWQISGMTSVQKEQFVTSLQSVKYIYVIPIAIMGLLSHYFRGLRWKLLIDPIKPVSRRNAFYATLLGYFGNTFVPRAGEILRCTMLSKYENVPFSKLIGTVIIERGFDLICFISFIFLTIAVQTDVVGSFVSDRTSILLESGSGGGIWLIVVILAGIVGIYLVMTWLFKRFAENKTIAKIKSLWAGLKEGLSTVLRLEKKGGFLFYTLMIWVMYLSQIYLGFRTMDVTAHLGIGAAMSVLTLSTLAMIVSPGGLGAFPVAVQQVLLVYHVDNISFGWLVWGVNTAIILVAGGLSFLLLHLQNRYRYENDKQDTGKDLQSAGTY